LALLARALAREGVATLRFDVRGVGDSTGDFASMTTLDRALDATAAMEFAWRHPEFGGVPVGLVGHSEGGLVAALVAARDARPAFVVMLGSPGKCGERVMLDQEEMIARGAGETDDEVRRARAMLRRLYRCLRAKRDPATLRPAWRALVEHDEAFRERRRLNGGDQAFLRDYVGLLESPWFRCFARLDPARVLGEVRAPVLAMIGSLDRQVRAGPNLRATRKALRKGKCADFKVLELPGLNHFLQPSRTGAPTEYGTLAAQLDPGAIAQIVRWIQTHAGPV
jgi:pimeloyl-ACP methyl ester carboxylesterase